MADTSDSTPATGFAALGLSPALLSTLAELGYEEPTPIQEAASRRCSRARTCWGRRPPAPARPRPSRCPCSQRLEVGACKPFETRRWCWCPPASWRCRWPRRCGATARSWASRVVAIYGGQEIDHQLRALKKGVDVVVATPGRALDHLRRKTLQLEQGPRGGARRGRRDARHGLRRGPRDLLGALPERSPDRALLGHPAARASPPSPSGTSSSRCGSPWRRSAQGLGTLAEDPPARLRRAPAHAGGGAARACSTSSVPKSALIFCRTRLDVDELTERLVRQGHHAAALHGGMIAGAARRGAAAASSRGA